MKRILSLILAAMMLLCCVAMAEESKPEEGAKINGIFSTDHFADKKIEKPSMSFDMKADNLAPTTADAVTADDSTIIVKTPEGVLFMLAVPANYTIVTQDYTASIFSLMRFQDPEALLQAMIDDNMHLLFINDLNNTWTELFTWGTDGVASLVGNLNILNDDRVIEYANAFGDSYGCNFTDIIKAGGCTWMRFNDCLFVTVVGGQYIVIMWEGDEGVEFTDDNLEDICDLLNSMTIFA